MTTARSIIEQAARKIHVLGRGQTLSAEEANDALTALNSFLGTFTAQASTIYNTARETFSLTAAQSFTIGTGGVLNTAQPVDILAMFITSGATDYPLVPITLEAYNALPFKSLSGIPEVFYYENNSPLGRIFMFPVPSAAYTVTISSLKALTTFADLTTNYVLPDGVEAMLVDNLAVKLCPDYEKPVSIDLSRAAKESKTAVETSIRRSAYPTSTIDGVPNTSCPSGNIFSGYYS
jgi:hypothetical protein